MLCLKVVGPHRATLIDGRQTLHNFLEQCNNFFSFEVKPKPSFCQDQCSMWSFSGFIAIQNDGETLIDAIFSDIEAIYNIKCARLFKSWRFLYFCVL